MSAMASQITNLTIVCSSVYSGGDQRKYQSSASLAFVGGIHRWPVNSPHKGPVTRKMFHLMTSSCYWRCKSWLIIGWLFVDTTALKYRSGVWLVVQITVRLIVNSGTATLKQYIHQMAHFSSWYTEGKRPKLKKNIRCLKTGYVRSMCTALHGDSYSLSNLGLHGNICCQISWASEYTVIDALNTELRYQFTLANNVCLLELI